MRSGKELVVLALAVVASGCAARAEVAPPPAVVVTPAPESPADAAGSLGGGAAPPPPPAAAPSPAAVPQPVTDSLERGASLSTVRKSGRDKSDLATAESQLEASAGDCATACRALGSMERATAHLCQMARGSSDVQECQDAKLKVVSGRDRVRASCGDCPGGPSLDRNAPIPSTR
jgi:hypothetical protein